MPTVVCQEWTESERGWGCRPDGATLHVSKSERDSFIEAYWEKMPKEVPDEYSRPDGEPKLLDVDDETYAKVKAGEHGIWLLQCDYSKLLRARPELKVQPGQEFKLIVEAYECLTCGERVKKTEDHAHHREATMKKRES